MARPSPRHWETRYGPLALTKCGVANFPRAHPYQSCNQLPPSTVPPSNGFLLWKKMYVRCIENLPQTVHTDCRGHIPHVGLVTVLGDLCGRARPTHHGNYCQSFPRLPTGLMVAKAKGYPDLVTRSFLHLIHGRHAELPIFVLTDFDPDGLNIFRCYCFGPDGAPRESAAHTCGIRWLGVKSRHLQNLTAAMPDSAPSGGPLAGAVRSSMPYGASRASVSSTGCREATSRLMPRDRRLATRTLAKLSARCTEDPELERLQRELRIMLMMGVKAETQWLDDAGNLTQWLDDNIGLMLSPMLHE